MLSVMFVRDFGPWEIMTSNRIQVCRGRLKLRLFALSPYGGPPLGIETSK